MVSGTYGASTTTYGPSTQSVDVVPANGVLTMLKTAAAPTTAAGDSSIVDVGDTIVYTYVVTNTGNVTLNNVTPVDTGPKFNSLVASNSLGTFSPSPLTLAPGAAQTFTATYTLSNLDAYHAAAIIAGVSNTSHATGQTVLLATVNSTDSTATTTIPAGPKLSVNKVAVLDDGNGSIATKAEVGEYIDYTYTVANIGNVPMTDISINDTHEGSLLTAGTVKNETLITDGPYGVSTDTTTVLNDGVWSTLQPGATITFTYHHLVTQAEVDGG